MTVDLVTFTEEIRNGKLHLCAAVLAGVAANILSNTRKFLSFQLRLKIIVKLATYTSNRAK